MDRKLIVYDLLELTRPLNEILLNLKDLPWDCEMPLVTLEQRHFASVLRRYRDGNLSGEAVQVWANAIELRDDIDYEPETIAGRLLHELANPLLTAPLTPERAAELLDAIMDEQHRVHLVGGNDGETAIFTLFDEGANCRLRCEYRDKTVESTATDFFQALCDVRGLLAEDGLIPFCYGASLNVYPSGMARDMGGGLKAYKMTMGRHAKIEDLVYIFAEGPDVIPASVAAQEQFWRDWLASARR